MTRIRVSLAIAAPLLACLAGVLNAAPSGSRFPGVAVRAEGIDSIIAEYLATNCAVTENRMGLDGEEQLALDQVNAYRAAYGVGPLRLSASLERVAVWKSTDLAVRAYMAHDDGFRSWEQRFVDCGYDYMQMGAMIAENLAAG